MGRLLNAIDGLVSELTGTAYPARGLLAEQLKWLSQRTAPDPQDIERCHGLVRSAGTGGGNSLGGLWKEVHGLELAAGRTCEDFARRFQILGTGLQMGMDFARIADEAALEVEEAAVREQQERLAAQFEEKRARIQAQADHRAACEKQRVRLEKLRLLPSELADQRAAVLADLSDLANPDSTESSLPDCVRIERLHARLAAIDAAAKAAPGLIKSAESRLAAFEKNRPA